MEAENTWARAEAIFAEALERAETEREAFVQERCGGDATLSEEVLKLLAAQGRMGSFLETGMLDFRGQQFGAYCAVDEIGRGGMSVVYSGERVGGGFDKKVAIKVVLTQVGTAPETQILASLEHPNIARLLDGGVTSLGFRFLVMEYVEGVPFTDFGAALGETDKLRLFLQVCGGVQAAHRSLIVHRDLKPENILVTADGTIKLLDFGIAKMLAPTGAQTIGPRAYTVDYASPEQILGQPASTSNDIYSLGVLLCELVGGRLPRELSGRPWEDVARLVGEGGPVELPLRGDLALIAAKAMQGDLAQRYESAGAMARDIDRYLAGEAVEARPPSWGYRTRKFVTRHRYSVASAGLAALSLAGAAGYANYQARLADARFEQVRSLSRSVMFELHDTVQPLAGSRPARQMIANRSLTYLDALARDATASDEALLDAARGYLRMAEIQGKDERAVSAGQSAAAHESTRRAVETARRVGARSPGSLEARVVLADALKAHVESSIHVGKGDNAMEPAREAVALAREALVLADGLLAAEPGSGVAKRRAGLMYLLMAEAHQQQGDWKAAIAAGERALTYLRGLSAAAPKSVEAQRDLHQTLSSLSDCHFRAGDKALSHSLLLEALEVSKRLFESDAAKYGEIRANDLGRLAAREGEAKR